MLFLWGRSDILFTLPRWLWWADVYFDQMMYDWLYSSHGCLIWRCLHWGIAHSSWRWFCEMTVYIRHLLSRDHSALRAYPFWDDAFILGRSHLADFDIETPLLVYDRCSRWIIVIGTLGSIFSTYLVRLGYPLSFVTYLYILHWTLLYLHSSYQSLTSFEPTYFIILPDFIPFSWSEEDTD